MPVTSNVSQNIQFLNDLDVSNFSITQEDDLFSKIHNRSKLSNFFHWIIHLITFTLVPQNRELDRLTHQILKDVQEELEEATDKERSLAEKAIRNLHIVNQNNGGSQGDAIKKLLSTIEKIQSLPAVENLSGKEVNQKDDLLEEETMDDSFVETTPSEIEEIKLETPPDIKVTHIECPPFDFHPQDEKLENLFESLVDPKQFVDDVDNSDFEFLLSTTKANLSDLDLVIQICKHPEADELIIETILKANPPDIDDPNDHFFHHFIQEIKTEIMFTNRIAKYVFVNECPKRQKILASHLSPTVITLQLENIPVSVWGHIDDFVLLEVAKDLSYHQLEPDNPLLKAFAKGLDADRLYDLIEEECFYGKFWESILPSCSFDVLVQFINKVIDSPSAYDHRWFLEEAQLDLKIWKEASKQNPQRNYRNICSGEYSPQILASIVNEQINNRKFLRDFFADYFKKEGDFGKQKACVSHLKAKVFEFDKPEDMPISNWYTLFKALRKNTDHVHTHHLLIRSTLHLFNSPGFTWVKRNCIYALTKEQMELLPIQFYKKAEIRLLLGCLTEQLDDTLLATSNSLYADRGGSFFIFFQPAYSRESKKSAELEKLRNFSFKKNTRLLNYFLLWVLDRPSITPALPTWKWISCYYPGCDILQIKKIENNNKIQSHIKRLELTFKKT